MSEQSNRIVSEILQSCSEMEDMANAISQLQPVSHLSKSKTQWVGGIPGAIKEICEDKRLVKLMNEPIYQGKSFYQLAFYIINQTDSIVEKQITLQGLISKEDANYYGLVILISNTVAKAISEWYSYSPDMANASITIGDEKNVALYPSVTGWTKDALKKLDLPEELNGLRNEETMDSSGCLGSLVVLLLTSTSIIGAIAYGISSLV